MVYRPADRLLARLFDFALHFLAETMTTSFQKALAVLASVASVLAGIVTIASYLSGEDVALPPSQIAPGCRGSGSLGLWAGEERAPPITFAVLCIHI